MNPFSTSIITISREAVENNLNYLKQQFGEKVKISSVVKGNAYGHGICEFIPLAESLGMDHFSVFSAAEAWEVKKVSAPTSSVMIMGHVEDDQLEWAIENDISFFVFDLERIKAAIKAAKLMGRKAAMHIEMETGMNRTGFNLEHLGTVAALIKDNLEFLEVEGLCTHYAGAESIANYLRVKQQIRQFHKSCSWLLKNDIKPKILHTACSAAAMVYPQTRMNMVRVGIMQYGLWPSDEVFIYHVRNDKKRIDNANPLKRAISWKSKIMSIKDIPAGEFIGYGNNYLARNDMKVAVVPVGYSHGYSRLLSNQGNVLLHGKKSNVIGTVNMSLMIIDVTHIPEAAPGDEVMLIGRQGDETVSVASFGELSNQLNYELLTRMPLDIPRIVVE